MPNLDTFSNTVFCIIVPLNLFMSILFKFHLFFVCLSSSNPSSDVVDQLIDVKLSANIFGSNLFDAYLNFELFSL